MSSQVIISDKKNGTRQNTSLGEIIKPSRPKVSPKAHPSLSFIGMEHIAPHSMRLLGTMPASTMKSAAVHFQSGDVLYGRLRPYLNKVFVPDFEGLCSSEFIVFPANEKINPKWLAFLLNSSAFVSFASHLNTGDRPRVDFTQLSSYPVLLPPFDEQQSIVEEIEKQFTRLEVGVEALKRVQANLKRYRASVLKAACEGKLVPTEAELARKENRSYEPADKLLERILATRRANWNGKGKYKEPSSPDTSNLPSLPKGWCWATVGQLAASEPNSITDGPFGSNLKTEHYTDRGPRVIRLQNIGDGVFMDEEAHISKAHFERLQKHRVFANDIVIAGLGENPPRCCLIPNSLGTAIVKADCIRFKPHAEVEVKYMNVVLNSDPVRQRTKNIVHGVGRPRLNLGEIKSIILPIPPFAEQQRIVAEVERRLSVIEELETLVAANLKRASHLRQSILHQAFSGKLIYKN